MNDKIKKMLKENPNLRLVDANVAMGDTGHFVPSWLIDKKINENHEIKYARFENTIVSKESEKAIQFQIEVTFDDYYLADANNRDQRFTKWNIWVPKSQLKTSRIEDIVPKK